MVPGKGKGIAFLPFGIAIQKCSAPSNNISSKSQCTIRTDASISRSPSYAFLTAKSTSTPIPLLFLVLDLSTFHWLFVLSTSDAVLTRNFHYLAEWWYQMGTNFIFWSLWSVWRPLLHKFSVPRQDASGTQLYPRREYNFLVRVLQISCISSTWLLGPRRPVSSSTSSTQSCSQE